MLTQMSYSSNYMHESAKNIAFSVFEDPYITELMYGTQFDSRNNFVEMNRFRELVKMNSFIDSMYIFNRKQNLFIPILSPSGRENIDIGLLDLIQSIGDKQIGFLPIPRKLNVDISNSGSLLQQQSNVYTYISYNIVTHNSGIEGAVIVNIKSEYLKNIIQSLKVQNSSIDGKTFVIDANGVVVNESTDFRFLDTFSEAIILQKIKNAKESTGYFIDTVNDQKVVISYVNSPLLNWTFINIVPSNVIGKELSPVKWIIASFCIFILAVGFFVSFIVSRRLTTPIQDLIGKVSEFTQTNTKINSNLDDVALLSHAFTETFDRVKLMDVNERNQLFLRRNREWRNILMHPIPEGVQVKKKLTQFESKLQLDLPFLLIAIKMDNYLSLVKKFNEKDLQLYRYAVSNVAMELISTDFSAQSVDMSEDALIIILNITDALSEEKRRKLANILEDVQQWTTVNLKLSITLSVGYVEHNFEELNKSYQEVMNIAKYRLVFGQGIILWPETLKDQNTSEYKLSQKQEKQLLDALLTGKLEEVTKAYEELVIDLTGYSYDTIMSILLFITYSIYSSLNVMEGNSLNKFNVDFTAFTREISTLETIEQINERFIDLFTKITETLNYNKPKRNTVLAETIVNLITANYKDKSLCLESISSALNLSKMYVGKTFRDVYTQSVADYITEYRLKQGLEMLKAGNKHLSDILDDIGIENKNYFYKIFKQRMGVSFSEYKTKYLNDMIHGEE